MCCQCGGGEEVPIPSECSQINPGGWITLNLGERKDISTIVFLTNHNADIDASFGGTRTYGISSDVEDTCTNDLVIQDGSTNYASMVADINTGT